MKYIVLFSAVFLMNACVPNRISSYFKKHENTQVNSDVVIPKVYAVDESSYRFQANERDLWDSVITVLSANYAFKKMNIKQKTLLTSWDQFRYKDNVYRNQVKITVTKLGRKISQVKVQNKTQRKDSSSWVVPQRSFLELAETGRIINNVSFEIGAPKPKLPRTVHVAMKSVSTLNR